LPLWAAHAYLGFTPKPFEFCLTRAVPETPATGLGWRDWSAKHPPRSSAWSSSAWCKHSICSRST